MPRVLTPQANKENSGDYPDKEEGQKVLAESIVERISGLVSRIQGVYLSPGKAPNGINKKPKGKRPGKSVRVAVKDNAILVNIHIFVRFGKPIPETARQIQNITKDFIDKEYTDYQLTSVNIRVDGILFDKDSADYREQAVKSLEENISI